MIANRINFQRVYDLTERVLPQWVDTTPPTLEERDRYWIEQGVLALGICELNQIAEYAYHMRRALPKPLKNEILDEGLVIPVTASAGGWRNPRAGGASRLVRNPGACG